MDECAKETALFPIDAKIDALKQGVRELATKDDLRDMELRLRLHLYVVAIIIIGVLGALELLSRWAGS